MRYGIHPQRPRGWCKNWFAKFRDDTGRIRFRSTKTTDKKQAQAISDAWEYAGRLKKTNKLNVDTARQVIEEGVRDIFMDEHIMPSATVGSFSKRWTESCQRKVSVGTWTRYSGVVKRFLTFLGPEGVRRDISTVTVATVSEFINVQLRDLSVSSAKLARKVLGILFQEALEQELVTKNVVRIVRLKMGKAEQIRRPFTREELQKILTAAGETPWQGMIYCGLYLGQRLSDLANLQWRQVDLLKREVHFITGKTKRAMTIPMAKPLAGYFESLPSTDNPDDFVFSDFAEKKSGTLSNWFFDLMVSAGLATKRKHEATGKGRHAARPVSALTFHCLRHTATSMLKNAGVTDSVAKELIGHESNAVSKVYTHISPETLRKGVDLLPDLVNPQPAKKKGKGGK